MAEIDGCAQFSYLLRNPKACIVLAEILATNPFTPVLGVVPVFFVLFVLAGHTRLHAG